MKIAIDVQTARVPERVGMGSYVDNLVVELEKLGNHQYVLCSPDGGHDLGSVERFYWDQWQFPGRALRERVDVIHQPAFSVPLLPRVLRRQPRLVVTVHDLIIVHFPQNMPLGSRLYFSRWMPFSYRFSDAIICDSVATKKDLLRFYPELAKEGEQARLLEVIHLAASQRFKPVTNRTELHRVKKRYQTGERFVLHVGTLEPRKNLTFLVKVFSEVVKRYPSWDHNLVITGKKGWYYEGLFEQVRRLGLTQRILFPGYVSDEDLPALYSAAELFVFPSQYEGFGLPPLEAMQCGTPVIVANNSSLPEVVGDAGLLIETDNISQWMAAIISVLKSRSIAQKLHHAGLLRSELFSWQKTAEKTEKIYEQLREEP